MITTHGHTPPPRIPPEVADIIIDFLHDDRHALAACSLVCRASYSTAHYHLLQTLDFPTPRSVHAFWRILQTRPAFGCHARSASFAKLSEASDAAYRFCTPAPASPSTTALTTPPPIELWSQVFHALPNVNRLEFLFLDAPALLLRHSLASAFGALEDLTLQYCRFKRFGDFVALFWSFPKLARLTLRGVSWEEVETVVPSRPHPWTSRRAASESGARRDNVGAGINAGLGAVVRIDARSADGSVSDNVDANAEGDSEGAAPDRDGACASGTGLVSLHLGRDLDLPTLAEWLVAEELCVGLRSLSLCSASQRDAVLLGELVRVAGPTLHDLTVDWYALSYNGEPSMFRVLLTVHRRD